MYRWTLVGMFLIVFASCGKKSNPSKGARVIYKSEAPAEREEATPRKAPAPRKSEFPKSIYVNDAAASKSVDGRLYYDVKGHRYWKNYKDGKYYLFDKSMYENPDFKPPASR